MPEKVAERQVAEVQPAALPPAAAPPAAAPPAPAPPAAAVLPAPAPPPPAAAQRPPELEAPAAPLEALADLKSATVFIKVEAARAAASGSGFLIEAADQGGYVVTNHHVTTNPDKEAGGAPFAGGPPYGPFPGGPGFGIIGGPPFGPFGGMGGRPAETAPTITIVFWSGTRDELSVRAEVVADDSVADLAVLKFRSPHALPRPIDVQQQPRLVETMPVYILGFPFGEALALNKGNPAVTVGKGSVSSLRMDKGGELSRVQIDGDLNPGNSGGPVVDGQGRLAGVVVEKVKDTHIGFAIPASHVTRLLAGRVSDLRLSQHRVVNGTLRLRVDAALLDPLHRLRDVAVCYQPGDHMKQAPADPLPGAQQAPLAIQGASAFAELELPPADEAQYLYTFQVRYLNGDGQEFFTGPQVCRVTPLPPPGPKVLTDAELDQVLRDLKGDNRGLRSRAAHRLAEARPGGRRQEVLQALRPMLEDKDGFTRVDGARAVANWAPDEGLPDLLKLLKDKEARGAVLDIMARLKDPRSADAVAECFLYDRGKTADVLRAIGSPAEGAVVKYLDHPDRKVREVACEVLKTIGTERSVPALQKAGTEEDPVGGVARAALKAIAERQQGQPAAPANTEPRPPADEDRAVQPGSVVPNVPAEAPLPAELKDRPGVDLIPLLSPRKDVVFGRWLVAGPALHCNHGNFVPRVQFPYLPPEEYDFVVTFCQPSLRNGISLIMPRPQGGSFFWFLGNEGGAGYGFHADPDKGGRVPGLIKANTIHTTKVEVRKDGVRAFVDGTERMHLQTDFRDLTCDGWRQLRDVRFPGLACDDPTVFYYVRIIEVTGRGTKAR